MGPWLGGLAISAGLGYHSPLWLSALLVTLALVTGAVATALRRRSAVRDIAGRSLVSGKRPVR